MNFLSSLSFDSAATRRRATQSMTPTDRSNVSDSMHAFNDVVSAVFDHSFAVNSEVDLFLRHFDRELGGRRRRTRRTNSQDAGDRSITTKDNGKNHIDCNFDPSDANNKSNSHGNHHHTHTEINVVEHELLRAEKYANRVSNELCDTVAYHCQNHLAELNQTIRATNEFLDISLHKGIAMQKKRERRMMANAEDLQQIKDRIGKELTEARMKLEANHNEQMAALIKKYKEKNSTNTPVNTDKKASTNKRKDKDGREINDKDDSSDKDTDSDDDDDGAAATKGVEGLP